MQALRMIRDAEGGAVRRLWTGYTALAARNLPFTAIQFPFFEAIRARIWVWRDRQPSRKQAGGVGRNQGLVETGVVTGMSAAASGAFAAVLTTPTDVIKTRMMLSAGEKRTGETGSKPLSGYQVAQRVYWEKGVRGLFRGGSLRASWTALGSGLYLATYEVAKVWLKGGKRQDDDDGI
jgi:solute carrier family 25 (mitochondrial S-adenosylmethionine transporter), member 26